MMLLSPVLRWGCLREDRPDNMNRRKHMTGLRSDLTAKESVVYSTRFLGPGHPGKKAVTA